jgi:Outer membrane protein
MTKNVFMILLSAFILSGGNIEAQEYMQKYSLQQCLDFAVNNSYAAHRASLDIREAEHQIREARAGVLPQINGFGSFDNNIVLPTMMMPGEIIGEPGTQLPVQIGTKNTLDLSVAAEQIIFAPSLFTGIKIAKNNGELQRLRAKMTKEEIIFDVSYVYYDILNSMQELDNINYMITKQDSLSLLMKRRVEENITREVDLNRVKVNLTNLRARSENIKNTISQQKRYMQILIGMPVGDLLELDDSEAVKVGGLGDLGEDDGLNEPSSRMVDILNKQKDIIELDVRLSKMGYLPTLSAIASAGYQFQADNMNLSKEPWFSTFIVGVRLSVPIFDGFSKRSQIKQKQVQLKRLEWEITETKQHIFASYRDAKDRLQVIYHLIQAQSENLQLAEKVYTQTMALYSEGLANITDLLETETSLREAKIAYTAELIRYRKTEIDLSKASGTLLERTFLDVKN